MSQSQNLRRVPFYLNKKDTLRDERALFIKKTGMTPRLFCLSRLFQKELFPSSPSFWACGR